MSARSTRCQTGTSPCCGTAVDTFGPRKRSTKSSATGLIQLTVGQGRSTPAGLTALSHAGAAHAFEDVIAGQVLGDVASHGRAVVNRRTIAAGREGRPAPRGHRETQSCRI